jgi:hypothetical protein
VREHVRVSGTVLLDAVGINVEGIELADFFSLTPQELIRYAFHDPAAAPDPTRLPLGRERPDRSGALRARIRRVISERAVRADPGSRTSAQP